MYYITLIDQLKCAPGRFVCLVYCEPSIAKEKNVLSQTLHLSIAQKGKIYGKCQMERWNSLLAKMSQLSQLRVFEKATFVFMRCREWLASSINSVRP